MVEQQAAPKFNVQQIASGHIGINSKVSIGLASHLMALHSVATTAACAQHQHQSPNMMASSDQSNLIHQCEVCTNDHHPATHVKYCDGEHMSEITGMSNAEMKITEYFAKVREWIDEREKRVLQELRHICEDKLMALLDQHPRIQNLMGCTQYAVWVGQQELNNHNHDNYWASPQKA
eukprot:c121_g1_i1.p1 GENE.c121_g1_i1~~c121_g1_i1.p1  ORF type:complete len:177 (+),score=26.91 c121_g1_i1:122-652(+)